MPSEGTTSIHILPPEVADQIAAGEVVERPSSVVKELAENSLDAGAASIDVETLEAGRRLMVVADDGQGMGPEDLKLAVLRHATSKISAADDLWNLMSFGFRGEALPSIASVSRMTLTSRAKGSAEAWKLHVEAGKASPLEPASLARGTRIEVRDLFHNTPARLKFLKAPATENARIAAALQGLALASPATAFRLRQEGRESFHWPAAPDLAARACQVLGQSFIQDALPLDMETAEVTVRGWVGRPHTHRGTRSGQWLFVAGRAVDHRLFNFTLSQAFGSLIPAGRFAQALVYLDLPQGRLDVNVHPAKREVRFVREAEVLAALRHAVRKALDAAQLSVPVAFSAPAPAAYAEPPAAQAASLLEPQAQYVSPAPAPHQAASGWMPAPHNAAPRHAGGEAIAAPAQAEGLPVALAQLHRTYIVCQAPDGLVLVDQHAGHERVLYERMLKRLQSGPLARQALLLPQKLSLGPAAASRLRAWMPTLERLGLEVSDLGAGDFFITHLPSLPRQMAAAPLLQDLLDASDEAAGQDPADWLLKELAGRMACKAAVKAGDPLTLEEMRGLIAELFACEIPWACPHGRPPFVSVNLVELEKYFQRR